MQELVANYLFQYKTAVLPHVGTLRMVMEPASSIFGEQKIAAPIPVITFNEGENEDTNFIEYIAAHKHISAEDATSQLKAFSEQITSLQTNNGFSIANVGKFSKDDAGKIIFEEIKVPSYFFPPVHAERVIHPNDSHSMLVGDKETNTAAMVEYYTEDEPAKKSKWWVWALVLFAVAIAAVVLYYNGEGANAFFGNAQKYEIMDAESTYKLLP